MTRQEKLAGGAVLLALIAAGVVCLHGSVKATADHGTQIAKRNLVDATAETGEQSNRWTSPSWEMAKVRGAQDCLRMNHPLFRRPEYIGCNRHKVMCDGWNGWYYSSPENEVL